MKEEQQVKLMRTKVFHHMLETRGGKYRAFLRYLRLFKYAAFAPTRGEFLESYYVLMRYLDDVVDGDAALPAGYLDESEYLLDKIAFSMHPKDPKDEVDFLMKHCFKLAEKLDKDFQSETKDILESLLFDARRRGKWIIFPEEELNWHFHILDIRGTIRATLKIFNDDPDKYLILEHLGKACRYQYDIEDFEADIAAGYVNVSKEGCEQFGLEREELKNSFSPNVNRWLEHHAKEGMALLEKHRRVMPQGKFSLFEKLVFRLVYEDPARKIFLKVISEAQNQNKTNNNEGSKIIGSKARKIPAQQMVS